MFGSGISFSGLASGLDTGSIIQQLVQLEGLPIKQLETKKKEHQEKLSSINGFKALVKDLQKQAKGLATHADFLVFTVTPSQEGVASFAATGSAASGAHTLTVERLAAVDRWAFDGVASATADLGAGDVSFEVGGTLHMVTVAGDASSLEEIAAAINEQAGADVSASVVNAGTTAAPSWKLVLTSDESGSDHRITAITSSVGSLAIDGTAADAAGVAQSANHLVVGGNAVAIVDGLSVERESNDFNDVLPGVSITVESADPARQIHFSVEADEESIKKKLQGFVDSFNKVTGFVNEQNTYDKEAGPGGKLFGDTLLSSVRKSIHDALFNVDVATVTGDTLGYSTLNLIGIEIQSDGTLLVDNAVFDDKLAENLEALADLFVDSDGFDNGGALPNTAGYYTDTTADSGLAAKLDREIDRLFKSFSGPNGTALKGLFDSRNEAIHEQIKKIDKDIAAKQVQLEKFQESLQMRFAKLEEVMGGLNAQGAALQAALAGLI